MKDGLRFVDSDMHITEPADLFEKYLDPASRSRVTTFVSPRGKNRRYLSSWIDGRPVSVDDELERYRKPVGREKAASPNNGTDTGLSGSRVRTGGKLDFAIERGFDAEAQIMAMEMEGIDIAVMYPTGGLAYIAREDLDPHLSLAISQAYNNWIYEFCQYSPDQLKFAAMLPMHDVNLACQELVRSVTELGAVSSFIGPNQVGSHFWHSNIWDPLYSLHEELNVTWGFHAATALWNSPMIGLYGENRFYRHVASHWIAMQLALIAQIVGGVFEFHPNLRVGYLEAQNSWVPGLLTRIGWDYPNYRDSHAPYLSLPPREYFRRNCWAAVEGSEPEIEGTANLIGADRMCLSTDYPHFDSNFPNVSNNLLQSLPRDMAAEILSGGARLYGLGEEDFKRADVAVERRKSAALASGG